MSRSFQLVEGLTARRGWGAMTGCFPRRRIVCLTEETVETLYLLGEQDRLTLPMESPRHMAQAELA
jgi:ABC-type hemin transport system substrate-binding protein